MGDVGYVLCLNPNGDGVGLKTKVGQTV
jgi:hypothetical protein